MDQFTSLREKVVIVTGGTRGIGFERCVVFYKMAQRSQCWDHVRKR